MAQERTARPIERGSRRELIADAVIRLIGEKGVREVTHRKIDQFLGLREGSTSPYFPKVFDLLNAGLVRLSELDSEALRNVHELIVSKAQDTAVLDPATVSQILYGVWREASKPEHRYLLVARFEFVLLGDRQIAFRDSNIRYFEDLVKVDSLLFAKMGAKNPAAAAWEYGVFRRGLWFTLLIAPPGAGTEPTPAYFEAQLCRIMLETGG